MAKLGIVGGMGARAGIDLATKLLSQCKSNSDQDYIPIVLSSVPSTTSDRSEYLTGLTKRNPAAGIVEALKELELLRASVVGIPCHTSHAPQIYRCVTQQVEKLGLKLKVIHLVDEVMKHLQCYHSDLENIGVLSTFGTRLSNIYPLTLRKHGFNAVELNDAQAMKLHDTIYDPVYGIKSQSFPPSDLACKFVRECVTDLIKKGADAILLACTELPLVIKEHLFDGVHIIDSTLVLARGMVESVEPAKLKPWRPEITLSASR